MLTQIGIFHSLKKNGSANQKDTRLPHSVRKDRLSRSKVLGEHSTVKRLCTSIEKSFNVGTSQIEGLTKKKQSRHDFSLEIFLRLFDITRNTHVQLQKAKNSKQSGSLISCVLVLIDIHLSVHFALQGKKGSCHDHFLGSCIELNNFHVLQMIKGCL